MSKEVLSVKQPCCVEDTLKMALEALSKSDDFLFDWHENESDNEADAYALARQLNEKAITAIKEALANHIEDNLAMVAQPEQEPIKKAWQELTLACQRVSSPEQSIDLRDALDRFADAVSEYDARPLTLDYIQGHKDGCEWSARLATANDPRTGDWLYDDPYELAKALRKGPEFPPVPAAQPKQEPVGHRDGYWCDDLTCKKCYSADFRFKHKNSVDKESLTTEAQQSGSVSNEQVEPSSGKCDADVFEHGTSMGFLNITKEEAEQYCKRETERTGYKHDWHYVAGRVHVKALLSHPPVPTAQPDCTRSHPHEEMSKECELRTEIARLTNCLKRANAQAEHLEREWYLRGDEIERLTAQPDGESILGAIARGWCYEENANKTIDKDLAEAIAKEVQALYTTPPQRKPLTDEKKYALIKEHLGLDQRRQGTVIDRNTGQYTDAARYFDLIDAAIEAAHGITSKE